MRMVNSMPLQRQNDVDYHPRPYLSKKKSKEAANRHAKAESERRKRINSHLSTLKKLFPYLPKKDKPRVLTEAVKQLKELRKKVAEQLEQHKNGGETGPLTPLFLPGENDEVSVIPYGTGGGEGESTTVKATICCEDRPGLNRDLTEAVQSVKGRVVMAEMATVGGRTKVDVVVRLYEEHGGGGEMDLGPFRRALKAVVENRSLGSSMLLCRRFQADKWAGQNVDPYANKSAQICGPIINGSGLPDGLLINTLMQNG